MKLAKRKIISAQDKDLQLTIFWRTEHSGGGYRGVGLSAWAVAPPPSSTDS